MTYVSETISPSDMEKIFADADPKKQSHLRMRGGHFTEGIEYEWAIDREKNRYLFMSPKLITMSFYGYFYFYFNDTMYALRLQTLGVEPVQFDDPPPELHLQEFQQELVAAFAALQSAKKWQRYIPTFASEESAK